MASISCDDMCVKFVWPACYKLTQPGWGCPILYNDLRVDLWCMISHVIYPLAISSFMCIHGGPHKDGGDADHHKIRSHGDGRSRWRHGDGVHGGTMEMETTFILFAILFTMWYDHIYMPVMFTFSLYYSVVLCMWWMFCHDTIAFLRKVEFWCHLPIAAPINFDRCVVGLPKQSVRGHHYE